MILPFWLDGQRLRRPVRHNGLGGPEALCNGRPEAADERIFSGIDIGGTFTDLVIHDHDSGRRWGSKVLTTHADPQQGVVAGVRTILAESGLDPRGIGRVVHATTLFTNALIERKGAPTGLLVTDGFRDMLEIGRERKYDLYDIGIENPAPLVPRNLRLGVSERMRADGRVAEPLDEAQLLRQVDVLRAAGVTSVALVFLHAYANPAHEEQAARAIAAHAPELFVTPSHQVVREIREYERASTTVASAYVKPIAAGYLAALARELTGLGIAAPLLLMLSGGGLTHAAEVNRNPMRWGQSLAQNTGSIPSFIGTLPATVRHFLGEFGPDSPDGGMQDGDVYITNNPWQGTGHLPDVCVAKPVFRNGRLVAFAAACSHVPDIGGMVRSVEPREVFEEGLHIPLMRFMRNGVADATLIKLLRTNVRTPD